MNAAGVTHAARLALGVMVEREERRTGSRDVAIEFVAQKVGASASWIKKFISSSPEVKEPRITLFMNIRDYYEQVCARVEQEHANELLKISKIMGDINAATDGFEEIVQRAAGALPPRKSPESRG